MTVVDLYTIQIIGDDYTLDDLGIVPAAIAEIEENLTDLLPDGYRARIRRWDDNPGDTDDR